MKTLAMLLLLGALGTEVMAGSRSSSAGSAGDKGSGCTANNGADKIGARVVQGAKDIITADGVAGRVKALRDTLNDNVNCMDDGLSDGVNKITGDSQTNDDSGE